MRIRSRIHIRIRIRIRIRTRIRVNEQAHHHRRDFERVRVLVSRGLWIDETTCASSGTDHTTTVDMKHHNKQNTKQ